MKLWCMRFRSCLWFYSFYFPVIDSTLYGGGIFGSYYFFPLYPRRIFFLSGNLRNVSYLSQTYLLCFQFFNCFFPLTLISCGVCRTDVSLYIMLQNLLCGTFIFITFLHWVSGWFSQLSLEALVTFLQPTWCC